MSRRSLKTIDKGCGMGEELDGKLVSYSLKITNRSMTVYFFKNILGMRILRHREYPEGYPYRKDMDIPSRWSSTIVSYGKEDNYFHLELIYVYGVVAYTSGNAFRGMTIRCNRCLRRAQSLNWPILPGNILEAPGGYLFYIIDEPQPIRTDPIVKITLAVANIKSSCDFYNGIIGFQYYENQPTNLDVAILELTPLETKLELKKIKEEIIFGDDVGKLGIGTEYGEQIALEDRLIINKKTFNIPLFPLDTPGMPTMTIFSVSDPDGYEIVFYEFSPYKNIYQYNPEDENVLIQKINEDESSPVDITTKKEKSSISLKDLKKDSFRSRLVKDKSQEMARLDDGNERKPSKLKLRQFSRSLSSLRGSMKARSSSPVEDEAGGSCRTDSQSKSSFLKGGSKSLVSIKELAKSLLSRSDIWQKYTKDKQEKQTKQASTLGDKTINKSEQVHQEDESNTQGSVATQEPVAREVQASPKIEQKRSTGVSNEANKSAQHTASILKLPKTSRGTDSQQKLKDNQLTEKSSKITFSSSVEDEEGTPPSKQESIQPHDESSSKAVEQGGTLTRKLSQDGSKHSLQDNLKTLLTRTASKLSGTTLVEPPSLENRHYYSKTFDKIPSSKIKVVSSTTLHKSSSSLIKGKK